MQDLGVEASLAMRSPCAWAAPTYKQLLDDWRTLVNTLSQVTVRKNEQEKQITLYGGGVIDFWSLDNADAIRGRKYRRFIINEAGLVPDLSDIWNMVVRPTLIDLTGDAYVCGTPKGMNGFWRLFNSAGSDWMRWQMSSYENPHIPRHELDALRETMSDRAFTQEILAQFLPDGAGVFRNVRALSTAAPEPAREGAQYIIGRDWARTNDASVSSVWDVATKREVCLEIEQGLPFALQISRLGELARRYNGALVIAEQNSLGDPLIEQAGAAGIRIMPFVTTNATKAAGVDRLALACERQEIVFQDAEAGILEMESFESSRTSTGLVKFSAPAGLHDDIVMARIFAHSGIADAGPVLLW